jgi:tight adherence protein C
VRARRNERARAARLVAELAEVVDLFVLAVGAGLTVRLATIAVAQRASGLLGDELRRALDETARGRRLCDALDDIPVRTCDAVRPLTAALVASERYGAPVASGLERLAADVRHDARRRAEAAARRVPVKLLFPLVCCSLPAFALLTVAPLIAGTLGSLRL